VSYKIEDFLILRRGHTLTDMEYNPKGEDVYKFDSTFEVECRSALIARYTVAMGFGLDRPEVDLLTLENSSMVYVFTTPKNEYILAMTPGEIGESLVWQFKYHGRVRIKDRIKIKRGADVENEEENLD